MPHLSPISWLISLVLFWTLIIMTISIMWWSYKSIPNISIPKSNSLNSQKWNWS